MLTVTLSGENSLGSDRGETWGSYSVGFSTGSSALNNLLYDYFNHIVKICEFQTSLNVLV